MIMMNPHGECEERSPADRLACTKLANEWHNRLMASVAQDCAANNGDDDIEQMFWMYCVSQGSRDGHQTARIQHEMSAYVVHRKSRIPLSDADIPEPEFDRAWHRAPISLNLDDGARIMAEAARMDKQTVRFDHTPIPTTIANSAERAIAAKSSWIECFLMDHGSAILRTASIAGLVVSVAWTSDSVRTIPALFVFMAIAFDLYVVCAFSQASKKLHEHRLEKKSPASPSRHRAARPEGQARRSRVLRCLWG